MIFSMMMMMDNCKFKLAALQKSRTGYSRSNTEKLVTIYCIINLVSFCHHQR